MLTIANIITIALFATGQLQGNEVIRVFWIFVCNGGFVYLITKNEIFPKIPIGTKSLLYGAHQFLFHPFTVFLAWHELYGWPSWKECICIFIHDWGYWGCPNMEGEYGKDHPYLGAEIAQHLLDNRHWTRSETYRNWYWESSGNWYYYLCLCHSRTLAAELKMPPSKLCWADKLCVKFDPWWFYLFRVWLSGEKDEYRREADAAGLFPLSKSDREWYEWARERMIRKAYAQDARPPYQEGS